MIVALKEEIKKFLKEKEEETNKIKEISKSLQENEEHQEKNQSKKWRQLFKAWKLKLNILKKHKLRKLWIEYLGNDQELHIKYNKQNTKMKEKILDIEDMIEKID